MLEGKNRENDDSLTLQQLAVTAGLTPDQVIEAASKSKKIEPWAGQNGTEYRFKISKKFKGQRPL